MRPQEDGALIELWNPQTLETGSHWPYSGTPPPTQMRHLLAKPNVDTFACLGILVNLQEVCVSSESLAWDVDSKRIPSKNNTFC